MLPGWVNIDKDRYPGVDKVVDIRRGLPFRNVAFIFAEHFIEHLAYAEALKLMKECRRVLRDDGVLRLSTPNLDWVWATHYTLEEADKKVAACFYLNRAFRGWGHQFLYNFETLAASLGDAGFANVQRVEYGESEHPELRGLERHEKSADWGSLSHILIVEAWGRGGTAPAEMKGPREDFLRDFGVK